MKSYKGVGVGVLGVRRGGRESGRILRNLGLSV